MARKQLRSSRELKSCSPLRGIAETSFTPKWDASGRKPKHCRLWKLSRILNEQLQNPIVQNDSRLRLRCLIAKGYTDIEIDYRASKRDWLEAQDIAKSLGEDQWVTRASGELGLIGFLEGNPGRAARLLGGALLSTMANGDTGGQVRFLELLGRGFEEV